MSFLAPAFLAGLAALALPVLIHLIHRERREVVEFPSLMFLHKIPYRSVRRQKLRHLLLLALRCLALAIVVAAFARPFFQRGQVRTAAGMSARDVVVLVDRSYSMGYGDRWTRALAGARRAVAGLGAMDRATLIAFDNQASALTTPTSEKPRLEAAISTLKPGAEGTRYGPALKLASQILTASTLPRKEVVLVTDFQRVGWSQRDEVGFPAGTVLTPVDVTGDVKAVTDLAVTDVTVQRSESGDRDRVTVAARITNTGATATDNVEVTLVINGRVAETKRASVGASSATQVRFATLAIPSGTSAGTVRLAVADSGRFDLLSTNNRFHFTVSPDAAVSVLVLEPANARTNQTLYFRRALAIGDRPSFRVDVKSATEFIPADLSGRSLVVLDEVAPFAGVSGARLREFVSAGGGLLIAAGDRLPAGGWLADWNAVMPGSPGAIVDRSGEAGGTIAWIDYDHPVFDLFNAPRSGDFATTRFLRYRAVTVARAAETRPETSSATDSARSAATAAAHVLARFDDGAAALVERPLGLGKIVVWSSTLDNYWNDLPLQPVFLPFVHQLAKYTGQYSAAKPWFTTGEVLDLSRHAELTPTGSSQRASVGGVVVESPAGTRTRLASNEDGLIPLHEQGFYEVRAERAATGSGRRVAVNVDPAESDLSRLDPQELRSAVLGDRGARASDGIVDPPSREDEERRQTLWWYMLAAAALLLATETVLSNRLSGATRAGIAPGR